MSKAGGASGRCMSVVAEMQRPLDPWMCRWITVMERPRLNSDLLNDPEKHV
jgi:hypothetical protein